MARLIETATGELERVDVDVVTLDLIENGLRNARYEMDEVLFRTALSPGIREQHDEFPLIADPDGKMVVGQFGAYISEMMRDWDRGIYPGDVILTSDPYKCSASISHTNDWLVLVPIFFEDEVVGWASQFGHQMDAGGRLPGSLPTGATTVFEEGLIIPPIKLAERGEVQEDVLRLILNNVRLPEMNRADLFAIVAGCRAGEKRVIELCERFGKDTYLAALQALLDRTHAAMKTLIGLAIPEEPQTFEDWIDDDGVDFKSVIDGSSHRFTPEVSMQIQHQLGADIMFAFDELTTLVDTRDYQEHSVERTRRWARRCLEEHNRLSTLRSDRPSQSLWGVVQGANYEDLRRTATRGLLDMDREFTERGERGFGGIGIGGALQKNILGDIVGWVTDELPAEKPRHLLGISEPDDIFVCIENGRDTFDCVAPTRLGRRGGVYTLDGRMNLAAARFKRDFSSIDEEFGGYVSENYSRAYIHHLLKAKEFLAGTLCTMHNLEFMLRLVDNVRAAIDGGYYEAYRDEFLGRYYAGSAR